MSGFSKKRSTFSLSWLPRGRWNILDLIDIGRASVATYMTCDVDMTWAENLRARLRELGHKTTITAILLKAIAIAQRNHPESRSALLPFGRVVTFEKIVAGFTVEREVASGPAVFLGIIRDPIGKSLQEIAQELNEYGNNAIKDVPQLELEDRFAGMPWLFRKFILWLGMRFPAVRMRFLGATFGVSSLGKYGVKTLIPPCVCTSIFGVGEVEQRPVAVNGRVEVRPIMTLTLNFDHRLIDGAPAARFMQEVRTLLEGELATHLKEELRAMLSEISLPQALPVTIGSPEEESLAFNPGL